MEKYRSAESRPTVPMQNASPPWRARRLIGEAGAHVRAALAPKKSARPSACEYARFWTLTHVVSFGV